jgi:hypothetical protein
VVKFSKTLNSAYGVPLNLNFANGTISVLREVFGLNGVEDVSKQEILLF